jgi:hypothetical protein
MLKTTRKFIKLKFKTLEFKKLKITISDVQEKLKSGKF